MCSSRNERVTDEDYVVQFVLYSSIDSPIHYVHDNDEEDRRWRRTTVVVHTDTDNGGRQKKGKVEKEKNNNNNETTTLFGSHPFQYSTLDILALSSWGLVVFIHCQNKIMMPMEWNKDKDKNKNKNNNKNEIAKVTEWVDDDDDDNEYDDAHTISYTFVVIFQWIKQWWWKRRRRKQKTTRNDRHNTTRVRRNTNDE